MKVLIVFLLLISWSDECNKKRSEIRINKITLYNYGSQNEVILNPKDNEGLLKQITDITNGYENNIPLMVTEDRLKSIQTKGRSLEVNFTPELKVVNNGGAIMKVNKILLLLEGELSSPANQESCLFLLANERGYIGNVYNSPKGNKSIGEIRKLIEVK